MPRFALAVVVIGEYRGRDLRDDLVAFAGACYIPRKPYLSSIPRGREYLELVGGLREFPPDCWRKIDCFLACSASPSRR